MASHYLERPLRSQAEVEATTHLTEITLAQNAHLVFKERLEAIRNASQSDDTKLAVTRMLDMADDLYHDEIGPWLSKAEDAVSEFDADREAESVTAERSALMFRQTGR